MHVSIIDGILAFINKINNLPHRSFLIGKITAVSFL